MRKHTALVTATVFMLAAFGSASADTVKMSGSATVFNSVVSPGKSAVEKATGHTLLLVSSTTGKGLADLVDGNVDIAMIGESQETLAEAAATVGKKLDAKTVQYFALRKEEIVFAVHPSNGVTKLSAEQLRDIHSGKITNWKDVGGKDLPIVVYSAPATGGVRSAVRRNILGAGDYAESVKAQSSVKRVAEVVANDPGGIGATAKPFVEAGKTKAIDTKKIEIPIALATIGAPKPAAKAVIDAYAKEAKSL